MPLLYNVVKSCHSLKDLHTLTLGFHTPLPKAQLQHSIYAGSVSREVLLTKTMNLFHTSCLVIDEERCSLWQLLDYITELNPNDPTAARISATFKRTFSEEEWEMTYPGISFPQHLVVNQAVQNRKILHPEAFGKASKSLTTT